MMKQITTNYKFEKTWQVQKYHEIQKDDSIIIIIIIIIIY
jgi:hypothetical protein